MTKNKELFYWQNNTDWYTCDYEGNIVLNNNAPERAKKSFEKWEKWKKYNSDENNLI